MPAVADMRRSCQELANASKESLEAIRRRLAELPPGPERESLIPELSRHLADYEHWKDYAAYYARLAEQRGPKAVVKVTAIPPGLVPPPPDPEDDPF